MSRSNDIASIIASDVTIAGDKTFTGDIIPSSPLSHRNLIINGAMQVAQRGTSSTVNGYGSIDRFRTSISGNDENATQSQHALTSSDTGPYEEGFRYSFHMTNGNQTSGAGSSDRVAITTLLEAQDIANSGWDYTSSSSYITLSFWCKSSVAQNFYGRVTTTDGTAQNYPFETGSLVADTWTEITKTIPGNSNLQFDNNNDVGLTIEFTMFRGTDTTGSITLNTWGTYNSSIRVPDMTSTWYTTNDATWEITGVQLELGENATPFEHRKLQDDLLRCQRYFYLVGGDSTGNQRNYIVGRTSNADAMYCAPPAAVPMRSTPTVGNFDSFNINCINKDGATNLNNQPTIDTYDNGKPGNTVGNMYLSGGSGLTDGRVCCARINRTMTFDSEL